MKDHGDQAPARDRDCSRQGIDRTHFDVIRGAAGRSPQEIRRLALRLLFQRHFQARLCPGGNRGHAIALIQDAPADGQPQRDTHVRMVETAAAHEALVGAVAKHHPGRSRKIGVATLLGLPGAQALGRANDFFQAGVVVRMRCEHAVIGARLAALLLSGLGVEQFLILEHADDADHRLGIVARAGKILGAEAVGLQFVLPAVAREQNVAKQ